MKYVTIPEPQTLVNREGEAVETLDYLTFLRAHVFNAPVWRESTDKNDLLVDLFDKFRNIEAGDIVEMEDAAFEIFKPLATLEGEKLNPQNAEAMNALARAALTAKKKNPKEATD